MKLIPLTQNKFAQIDDDDYESLSGYKWFAHFSKGRWYALRWNGRTGHRTIVKMHRQIMKTPDELDTDHIDGNGLNNQRYNLRNCLRSQNAKNCKKSSRNTSGYKGVSFDKDRNKWVVHIMSDGKLMYLGRYLDLQEAARAYDIAARKYHGEFARTNFK